MWVEKLLQVRNTLYECNEGDVIITRHCNIKLWKLLGKLMSNYKKHIDQYMEMKYAESQNIQFRWMWKIPKNCQEIQIWEKKN